MRQPDFILAKGEKFLEIEAHQSTDVWLLRPDEPLPEESGIYIAKNIRIAFRPHEEVSNDTERTEPRAEPPVQ